jgi:hypothetical protein
VTLYLYRDGGYYRFYWGYRNTSGHEFGHVFGIGDASSSAARGRPLSITAHIYDIMRWHLNEEESHVFKH